ncbi:MAG TPA: sulfite exporter TauE/SafE family protein [Crinalium sp.]
MLDLLLIMSLGFLGSFGHCVGMCGPIAVAFSLSDQSGDRPSNDAQPSGWHQFFFHLLLNVGRILSYALVGAGIGALGSVLLAGGQMAGVGSELRRYVAIFTGILLIWLGLTQVSPRLVPHFPILHPLVQGKLHNRLSSAMVKLSLRSRWWTPFLLGTVWGMIPCGFLYIAQIKAAESGDLWRGSAIMLAFGLGTLPTMLGVGVSAALVSGDRRSQLFRMGGWVTLLIGLLTLLRTGDTMVDYTGHAALVCLVLALIARPISRVWAGLLHYRRALGVGAFVLSLAHTAHMADHTWGWDVQKVLFMLPQHQWGVWMGAIALLLMAPAAFTSADWIQRRLGARWRTIHLLAVPALILSALHCILIGSHYLGRLQLTWLNWTLTVLLIVIVAIALLLRSRWLWSFLGLEKSYVPPAQPR